MFTQSYQTHLQRQLSPQHWRILYHLLLLLQVFHSVNLESLATLLPVAMTFAGRRKALQRLLTALDIKTHWFPLLTSLLKARLLPGSTLYLIVDRTQWKHRNLCLFCHFRPRRIRLREITKAIGMNLTSG